MPDCSVDECDRPTQEVICTGCLTELVTTLRELAYGLPDSQGHPTPGLFEELSTTRHRLANTRQANVKVTIKGAPKPLPFHTAAAEISLDARNTMTVWVRDFHAANPHLHPCPDTTLSGAARWLQSFPALLAMHPDAGAMHSDLVYLTGRIKSCVDRPPDLVYLGRCGHEVEGVLCEDTLYGTMDRDTVRCRTCGAEHVSIERWEEIRHRVREMAPEFSGTVAVVVKVARELYGVTVNHKTVYSWVARGQLVRRGNAVRLGDVLVLCSESSVA